jgi:hypothetical protein
MKPGDTFMIDDENETKEHLHVVLSEPSATGEVVTVSICTRHRWSEVLVALEVGDHPFITRPSFASYRHARIRKCEAIANALKSGSARSKTPITDPLLRRLQAALTDSDFVANEVRAFFKEVTGIA